MERNGMEDLMTETYHSRVKQKVIQKEFQALEMPAEEEPHVRLNAGKANVNLWLVTLVLAISSVVTFSVVQAYLTIQVLFTESFVLGALLSTMLLAFVMVLFTLIVREWQGLKNLQRVSSLEWRLQALKEKDSKATTLAALKNRQTLQNGSVFTKELYQQFNAAIRKHHSNVEILQIYHDKVLAPIQAMAKATLKKQSISAGIIGLVSPNSLIQSLGLLWMSLRTLRSVSLVYGIRPHGLGSIRLFRIALENLAAASITDLITDEISNQLGGSLGDQVLANSADAITAGTLNQRLGKALMSELDNSLF